MVRAVLLACVLALACARLSHAGTAWWDLSHTPRDAETLRTLARNVGLDPKELESDHGAPSASLAKAVIARWRERTVRQRAGKAVRSNVPIGAEPALFYTEVAIGTPARNFRVQLDSGSSTLAVPTKGCNGCEKHCNNPYDTSGSSTATSLSCTSTECCPYEQSVCLNYCAISPHTDQCGFNVAYADGTSLDGRWMRDQVTCGNLTVDMYLGAIDRATSNFEPFEVDGIIGVASRTINTNHVGIAYDTLIDALVNQHNMDRVFSMCFGNSGGGMLLGGVDTTHMASDPVYENVVTGSVFWELQTITIGVGNNVVSEYSNVVVDSGSTMWYVRPDTATFIQNQISNNCGLACDAMSSLFQDSCVYLTTDQVNSLPSVDVTFSGGSVASVPPTSYLDARICGVSNYYSFGILAQRCGDSNEPCIFGNAFMRGHTWVFEGDGSRVGFAPRVGCDDPTTQLASCPNSNNGSRSWFERNRDKLIIAFVCIAVACLLLLLARPTWSYLQRRRGRPVVTLRNPLMMQNEPQPREEPSQPRSMVASTPVANHPSQSPL